MSWLSGYNYRKAITLSRASGAVTDYQMKLIVRENAGAGADVDCGGKIQSGFHDLAFTDADGTTPLKYWIESITGISPNQLATIWIKFDSIDIGGVGHISTFYMYYGSSTLPDPIDVPTTCQWKRYPSNPILAVGTVGAWDDFWVQINSIWKEGSTYYAYYAGSKSDGVYAIGVATSADGITWSKNGGNPILTKGTSGDWDDTFVSYPLVWKEGTTWYMLYAGRKASTTVWCIGLATSADGISWAKDTVHNPVYSSGAAWDAKLMRPGTQILKEAGTYYLYYDGNTVDGLSVNCSIGLATSTDLITWTKSANNPILTPGTSGSWEAAVMSPGVIKFGSIYYMFYEGIAYDAGAFGHSYCGLATSSTKDSGWSKSGSNPILGTGGGTAWDNSWSELPILVNFGTEWRMYYSGSQGNSATPRCQGGFATYAKKGVGADTFIVFDDFERVPFAAVGGDWTVIGGAATISLDQSYGGARSCLLSSTGDISIPVTQSNNIAVQYRLYKADATYQNAQQDNGTKGWFVRVYNDEKVYYYSGSAYVDSGKTVSNDAWQKIEVADIIIGTSIDLWVNDVKAVNDGAVNWSSTGATNKVRINTAGAAWYLENFIVRNYRTTEPAWGSWGAEEPLSFTLSVDSLSHTDSLDAFAITQVHTLAVAALSHANATGNVVLTQIHQLAIDALSHAHSIDEPALTQIHQLIVDALSHTHSLDALDLFQIHNLVVQELIHSHPIDNIDLIYVATILLVIQDLLHSHSLDGVSLTQIHQLVIEALLHAHSIGTPTLAQVHQLVIQALSHANTIDGPALTQIHQLVAQALSHVHTIENTVLIRNILLATENLIHSHLLGTVGYLSQNSLLIAQTLQHAHAIDGGWGLRLTEHKTPVPENFTYQRLKLQTISPPEEVSKEIVLVIP